jgi:hypothetical protein
MFRSRWIGVTPFSQMDCNIHYRKAAQIDKCKYRRDADRSVDTECLAAEPLRMLRSRQSFQ